jgi:tRNA 2-selenouridine synthase
MDINARLPRLLEEYSVFTPDELAASVMRISKRLGGDNTKEAVQAIYSGDYAKAIEITLHYYDRAYLFGLKRKQGKNIFYINTDTDNIESNAMKVLDAEKKIVW